MSAKGNAAQQQQQQQQQQQVQLAQQQQQQMAAQAQYMNQYAANPPTAQTLMTNMPQLLQMAKSGQLSETQLSQLQNIMRTFGLPGQMPLMPQAQAANAGTAAAGGSRPGTAMTTQPAQVQVTASQQQHQQQQQQQQQPQQQQAQQHQQQQQQQAQASASLLQPTATTQKRSPMPDMNSNALAAQSTSTGASTAPVPDYLNAPSPGPQAWPNASGPRPTLSQGLATSSSVMGLPTHVAKPADTVDALGALNEGFKKDATQSANDLQMRRTIKDLVASIDPNVKLDSDVEDVLLHMADEFIDSVINFSCRLAKHRGSETLDVKDLQLHLERNHNIRIPGFSSDETRLAISHANPATGGQATKAARIEPKGKEGTDNKEGAGKETKKGKSKVKEGQGTGGATRSARLAAVRALR